MDAVRNAADPQQVRRAGRLERRREERYAAALRKVLATQEGRLVFGELDRGILARAGVYESPLHQAGSMLYYNVGRQDFGRMLLALIMQAGEEYYALMESEARALKRADERERQAGEDADRRGGDGHG